MARKCSVCGTDLGHYSSFEVEITKEDGTIVKLPVCINHTVLLSSSKKADVKTETD